MASLSTGWYLLREAPLVTESEAAEAEAQLGRWQEEADSPRHRPPQPRHPLGGLALPAEVAADVQHRLSYESELFPCLVSASCTHCDAFVRHTLLGARTNGLTNYPLLNYAASSHQLVCQEYFPDPYRRIGWLLSMVTLLTDLRRQGHSPWFPDFTQALIQRLWDEVTELDPEDPKLDGLSSVLRRLEEEAPRFHHATLVYLAGAWDVGDDDVRVYINHQFVRHLRQWCPPGMKASECIHAIPNPALGPPSWLEENGGLWFERIGKAFGRRVLRNHIVWQACAWGRATARNYLADFIRIRALFRMLRIAVAAWQAGFPPTRIATTAPPPDGDAPMTLPTGERLLPREIDALLRLDDWHSPIRLVVYGRELSLQEPAGLPLDYHQRPLQLFLAHYGPG